ncbi:Y-family DNA polymerase [Dyadobacter sp.]|uniref:Y-family DNA polymerase n=1 Tax=Dyadobacter sp. TaxID=1914288 RepID=UPI003F6FAD22
MKRYVAIWFRHLLTDRMLRSQPELAGKAFVLSMKVRNRVQVMAASRQAEKLGIEKGMVLADARAVLPELLVMDYKPDDDQKLLFALAEWMIRYSPLVAVDGQDGLILDATGCAHLWGGEAGYLKDMATRLKNLGYDVKTAMADTIGVAWAIARYSNAFPIIKPTQQLNAILNLPPGALRFEMHVVEKMYKLGLTRVRSFISMPRPVLRRRFGQTTLDQIDQALGHIQEAFQPVVPVDPYQERLPSLEPIRTAKGIEIALEKLLEKLCKRLVADKVGVRQALLKCFRIDGEMEKISIGTNAPSCSASHLFKLFDQKINEIEPDLGIELFVLEATTVEPLFDTQEQLWNIGAGSNMVLVAELLDRLVARAGNDIVHRYLPAEHYWPERSIVDAPSLSAKPATEWRSDLIRPMQMLAVPEKIQVTAPVPDYPPMLFQYKGAVHKIRRADGPDRVEQEWWLSKGLHRDYYSLEDEEGRRYWVFRLGHYEEGKDPEWFIHGFFA